MGNYTIEEQKVIEGCVSGLIKISKALYTLEPEVGYESIKLADKLLTKIEVTSIIEPIMSCNGHTNPKEKMGCDCGEPNYSNTKQMDESQLENEIDDLVLKIKNKLDN